MTKVTKVTVNDICKVGNVGYVSLEQVRQLLAAKLAQILADDPAHCQELLMDGGLANFGPIPIKDASASVLVQYACDLSLLDFMFEDSTIEVAGINLDTTSDDRWPTIAVCYLRGELE